MKIFLFIYVMVGGAVGSLLRYLLSYIIPFESGKDFPWPTFFVNILGSFCIGILFSIFQKNNITQQQYILLATGVMGGFTTFSAFSLEMVLLFRNGILLVPVVYISSTFIGGILMCWLGVKVAS